MKNESGALRSMDKDEMDKERECRDQYYLILLKKFLNIPQMIKIDGLAFMVQ
jgi:hypothetical protein